MKKNVVAISVEKVQKYIYSVLDDRDVIMQKDNMTLSSIISASDMVSKQIDIIINDKFLIRKSDEILRISGELIFISEKSENDILALLDEIFKNVYIKSSGKIFLNYTVFLYNENFDNMGVIKKSIEELKKSKSKTNVIFRNSDLLFKFSKVNKLDYEYKKDPYYMDIEDIYVENMDSLVDYKETKENGTNGKIAIIKADINNLGQYFQKCGDYKKYIKISEYLKKTVSIDYFADKLKSNNLTKKVLPIYIAGDDIFYAVKIDAVLKSVETLRDMIEEMNEEMNEDSSQSDDIIISLAVACVFVNNHQPIRYYRDAVEKKLSEIKNTMKADKKIKKSAILGLKILDNNFYFYKDNKKEDNNLNRFIGEISDLKFLMQKGILTNSFIYNLIYNIEHETNEKNAMNIVLHYLRPILGLSENSLYSMIISNYWLSFLVEKNSKKSKEKNFIPKQIYEQLLPRLKLTAMLLDEKYYSISSIDENTNNNYKYEGNIFWTKEIKSNLFNKPLNYLSDNSTELTKLFIGKEEEIVVEKKKGIDEKKIKKTVYKKLRLEKGCLFKCKKLIDSGRKDMIYDIIYNNVNIKKNEELDENPIKSQYIKEFSISKDDFYKLIRNNDSDWIDEVIIYYEYIEQRKEYLINTDYKKRLEGYKKKDKKEIKNKKN